MANLNIDKDTIRELAKLLDETGLTEIEVEVDGQRIRVGRGATGAVQPIQAAPVAAQSGMQPSPESVDVAGHPGAVTSPMVGTVYVAPEPSAPQFVRVGDKVSAGQTLFIIEAMKTMNPVAAPRDGTVTEILVADGQPVEFGEPLLVLE